METAAVFDEFLEMVEADIRTWQESEKGVNFELWRRDYDPSTTLCMRMEMKFPGISTDIAYDCLADLRVRKKWDHRLERYDIIEETKDWVMQYNKLMKVNIPFFSQRDQLVKQHLRKNLEGMAPGTHISVSHSTEHPDYPDGYDGCCRTQATMIGYLFEPDASIDGTKITWIYINDLKGSLPGMMV